MYFSGKLEIDPSQLTKIEKIKPTALFKKLIHSLSFGIAGAEKEEHETFSALAITQQLYSALKNMNIDDIVRISMNGHDFYLDTKGEKNDLEKAIFEFEAKVDPLEAKVFDNILFVVEHASTEIKYLVEIRIQRKHKVGEYPIQVIINGVMSEFQLKENETKEDLKLRMNSIFADSTNYQQYVQQMKAVFDNFINNMEMSVKKFMQVDDIKNVSKAKIIRAKERTASPSRLSRFSHHENEELEPIYHGYFAMNSFFFYSWIWSEMAYSNNVFINDVDIVDEAGADVMSIGEQGFNAGEFDTLNEAADFAIPEGADIEAFQGNEYVTELQESGYDFGMGDDSVATDSDSSWISDWGGDDGGFDDSGDFD